MKGTKFDFYKANIVNKAKLFLKKPQYILFYLERMKKYSGAGDFESFIISYPKSGRTWLQKLLIEAVKSHNGISLNISDISLLNETVSDFPSMLSTHAGSSWEEIVKNNEEIKVIDYHKYKKGKIVYLFRDPRDVLVSQYYHILHRTGYKTFDKNHLITNPNVGLLKIINFMNKWAMFTNDYPDNVLPISYEDLKRYTFGNLTSILDHIHYPVNTDCVNQAIENCSIERMRQSESQSSINPWTNSPDSGNNPNSFHSRKGITGEYKEFFSESDITIINKIIGDNLDTYYSQYI